jgi:hypothetical protein
MFMPAPTEAKTTTSPGSKLVVLELAAHHQVEQGRDRGHRRVAEP